MAKELGIGGAKSDIDLKLEEMRENREVDLKRLDWEQEKYKMETEADNAKWEQIGKILQGSIGDALKSVGNAGADRVRGGRSNTRTPKAIQTTCPNCQHTIYVDAEAESAICGSCGALLQKQGPPQANAPPAPPATATRVEPQTQVSETEEEEEETESSEGEGQPAETRQ